MVLELEPRHEASVIYGLSMMLIDLSVTDAVTSRHVFAQFSFFALGKHRFYN